MRASYGALVARKVGWFMRRRPGWIAWEGGVASFTFDDFPKSALTNGGAILESHGLRGTFYAALKLAGTENHLGPMFEPADLRAAHESGHEIACHTYSHLDCCRASAADISAEIDENTAGIAALIDGAAPMNFAYPYGAVSLAAKRAVATRFVSCRGTGQGINHAAVDFADLLGVRVYDRFFDADALRRLVDENRAKNGWLIFYTHDVSEQPSLYGCTPGQLDTIVEYAKQHMTVLPVREVAARLAPDTARRLAA